jgi:microcompartment protein CcmL/EutN
MNGALGIIEIRGLATAILVADVMVKTAAIQIENLESGQGFGWTTVKISGDVAAVTASLHAGRQAGEACGGFVTSKVIARPATPVSELFCQERAAVKAAPAAAPSPSPEPAAEAVPPPESETPAEKAAPAAGAHASPRPRPGAGKKEPAGTKPGKKSAPPAGKEAPAEVQNGGAEEK